MNVTLLKKSGSKEVINRVELADLAATIKNGMIKDAVRKTRELYHLMNPHRQDDGQITTQLEGGIKLPRICFVADYMNREGATKWSWRESCSAMPLSSSAANERTLTRVRPREGATKWSWREYPYKSHYIALYSSTLIFSHLQIC